METTQHAALPEKDAFARREELVALAELPPDDARKLEAFLRVRSLLAQVRPELEHIFRGLFEKGRNARDARTFLGRIREMFSERELTRSEFDLLLQASGVPGFSLIRTFLVDKTYPEEKLPVTERVFRDVPEPEAVTPKGGKAPMRCPNIGGL